MNTMLTRHAPRTSAVAPAPARGLLAVALLAAFASPAPAAPPPQCKAGTQALPACSLHLQGQANATITLPEDFVGTKTALSPSPYNGIADCTQRFLVRVDGDWTRLALVPRKGSAGSLDECTCKNMEASLQVLSYAEHSHCEGGCKGCTVAEFCAGNTHCECSFTPVGLGFWPVETRRATGVWLPASPLTGPAHCKLEVHVFRDTSSPAWKGDGAYIAAAVFDKRTGKRAPVIVEARNSKSDPDLPPGGGCPDCSG
jgi:hypothetical protein